MLSFLVLLHAVYASEIAHHYTVSRANLGAVAAICALVIVDLRQIVYNGNGADRTFLFALLAGYTAVTARFSGNRTLFGVRAGHEHFILVRHNGYELVWTN